jgi:hypothetical protein
MLPRPGPEEGFSSLWCSREGAELKNTKMLLKLKKLEKP